MSKEKNIIKTITIDIAGTEVEVTPSQARALHDALTELLGLPKSEAVIRYEYVPYWRWSPTYVWNTSQVWSTATGTSDVGYSASYNGLTYNANLRIRA